MESGGNMNTGDHTHDRPMVNWQRYWQVMAAKRTETGPHWWEVMAARIRQMMTHKNRNAA
jgi:hypothetical protein